MKANDTGSRSFSIVAAANKRGMLCFENNIDIVQFSDFEVSLISWL